jgi:uncharacterized damage-inducible protein DinB
MMVTPLYLQTWLEARTRFSNLLPNLTEADLPRKLAGTRNSAGFLIRHIADVELLFTKNVFGNSELKVTAKTVIAQHDTGEWTNQQALLDYQASAFQSLRAIIEKQSDADWQQVITTKEFGAKTRAEALGRIISHTAYHAGQLALTLKYGIPAMADKLEPAVISSPQVR